MVSVSGGCEGGWVNEGVYGESPCHCWRHFNGSNCLHGKVCQKGRVKWARERIHVMMCEGALENLVDRMWFLHPPSSPSNGDINSSCTSNDGRWAG